MLNNQEQGLDGINKQSFLQTWIAFGLILLIFSQIFSIAIKEKMHHRIPESLDHYAQAISIAISYHKYKLPGYVAYRSDFDTLINSGFNWENHTNAKALNRAIKAALAETNTNSEKLLFVVGDIGFIDYMRLAFSMFGFQVESLLYLYMVILLLQVIIFFISFRKNRLAIIGLILFLLSHYITGSGLVDAGYNLWTYHNNRFLSVLGVIPIFHIFLLAILNKKVALSRGLGAIFQILIYIFVLRCRMSAFWMMGPIILLSGVWFMNKIKVPLFKNKRVKLWPMILILIAVFVSLAIKPYIMDSEYYSEKNITRHTFWYSVYIGLAINPEIREIYGPRDPQKSIDAVSRFAEVCDKSHPEDSSLKAKLRVFVCNNREIAEVPLLAVRNWHGWLYKYTQRDQDAARAVLKWLRENGKSEEHLYSFGLEDKVGYPRWFGECDSKEKILQYNPENAFLRKFDSRTDFKWREMDRIVGEVAKDAFTQHPFKVLKTVFLVKPFFFFVLYFLYFIKLKSVVGLVVIILSYMYLLNYVKDISQTDMKRLLVGMFGMFMFSMIVTLTAYPAKHTISDQVVLLTMSLLGSILYFLMKRKKRVL